MASATPPATINARTENVFRFTRLPGARGALAGLILVGGVGGILAAAEAGPLRLGAGDVNIELARGDSGYTMTVAARTCPPNCSFDFDWRPIGR